MILTIANLKGGSARTTTAMYLASAYTRMGYPVTVVDTDPRANATKWARKAEAAGEQLPFPVISHPLPEQVLRDDPDQVHQLARHDAPGAVTILDTASATPQIVPAAAKISDFVLLPFATSPVDYQSTLDTLRTLTVPYAVVMTRVDRRTREETELRRRFQEEGVRVLKTTIPHNEAFNWAYGTTPGDTLYGYAELAEEIQAAAQTTEAREAEQLWVRG